jgi:hypothetical protein
MLRQISAFFGDEKTAGKIAEQPLPVPARIRVPVGRGKMVEKRFFLFESSTVFGRSTADLGPVL